MKDYKTTLNLPRTGFSMKADLPNKEPVMLKKWEEEKLYRLIRKKSVDKPLFLLHDGPPYSNGNIHMGHVLNKILKDIVVKFMTMEGRDAPFIPGWDCHGLPVEHQLFKELGMTKYEISQLEFRKKAHQYAMKFVNIQRDEFKRLGVFGDWENPYLTLNPKYEAGIIRSFGSLVKRGFIYKGLKPVNWCVQCETALAEAEVEYMDRSSPSIYVRFDLINPRELKTKNLKLKTAGNIYLLIWTTTPWTLLANVAIAVHPELDYAIVKTKKGNLIMAQCRLEGVMKDIGQSAFEVIGTVKGKDLENREARHPFMNRTSKVVLADYVTTEEGTGCVHTAPGHGEDDYITGKKYNLPTLMPIDSKGRVDDTGGEFRGLGIDEANVRITERLKDSGDLLASGEIQHSYPHCWRCKRPIIFRATEQYFMDVDKHSLRKNILGIIKKVKWIPDAGMGRISAMVSERPDWCLSRQRYWGVPIPGFYCTGCGKLLLDTKTIQFLAGIVEKEGSDAYFVKDAGELLPKGTRCPFCKNGTFKKEQDIVDVWFESGVSHQSVLRSNNTYPADLYLEGSDQHRGWFQSSLITAAAIDGTSPYRAVLTHGFVVDGEGKKMSKSLGNVISPQDVMAKYGADILRLWVASSDYTQDVRLSDQILTRLAESYRKIRNTLRYLLSNLYDYHLQKKTDFGKLLEIDHWALANTKRLLEKVTAYYRDYSFHMVYRAIYEFCVVFLSSVYLDILKDRMYTSLVDSDLRRSGQTVMHRIVEILIKMIAPILPFTAEEAWLELMRHEKDILSVHVAEWPLLADFSIDKRIEEKYARLSAVRERLLGLLESERMAGRIKSSLEAKVRLSIRGEEDFKFFKSSERELPAFFIVSQVELKRSEKDAATEEDVTIDIRKAEGAKCQRCWNYSLTVGGNKEDPALCERCVEILSTYT